MRKMIKILLLNVINVLVLIVLMSRVNIIIGVELKWHRNLEVLWI